MGGLCSSRPKRPSVDRSQDRTYYQPPTTPAARTYASPPSSFNSFEYIPRNIPSTVPTRPTKIRDFLQAEKISSTTRLLPRLMNNHNDSTITCTNLNVYETEYLRVQSKFRYTGKPFMQLKSIQKVQNPYLEALYELKKLELKMTYKQLEEVELFHGTPSENVNNINKVNLNYRYYGKGVGCKFGKGISFAPFSYYASHYCSKFSSDKHMYLCKVLKGKSHLGRPGLLLPSDGYDTTVKENDHVVVKFHDDVYYPKYILNFEKNQ